MKNTTAKTSNEKSIGRIFALTTLLFIFFILGMILQKNKNVDSIAQSINLYKSIETFEHTHLSGNELGMIYLAPERDQLESCISFCLETKNCVASNYYKGNSSKNQGGQCWLFGKIDPAKLSFTEACCELSIPSRQKSSLNLVQELLKTRSSK